MRSIMCIMVILCKLWRIMCTCVQVRLLGKHTDHTPEQIEKDVARPLYFDAYSAIDYGIIDEVCLRTYFGIEGTCCTF